MSTPRDFVPPILLKAKRALLSGRSPRHGWFGDYPTWHEASAASSGYDQQQILARVLDATRKVESGEAAYERDGVLFDRVHHNWPLLSTLMWIAARQGGELTVCDFGGSLGTVYRQAQFFLSRLKHVRWGVVEQKHFVRAGKAEFENQVLSFHETLADCRSSIAPTTLLLSSVLQYLPEPYRFLDEVDALGLPYLLLDRTTVLEDEEDRLTVQVVNPRWYTGSYPCWFFSKKKLLARLLESYDLVAEFSAFVAQTVHIDRNVQAHHEGFLLERKTHSL